VTAFVVGICDNINHCLPGNLRYYNNSSLLDTLLPHNIEKHSPFPFLLIKTKSPLKYNNVNKE